jgi:hypothetical protein
MLLILIVYEYEKPFVLLGGSKKSLEGLTHMVIFICLLLADILVIYKQC